MKVPLNTEHFQELLLQKAKTASWIITSTFFQRSTALFDTTLFFFLLYFMLTENLAEQRKWTDYVRPTDWIYEVDSDFNCDKKFLIKGNVQQLLSDKYKTLGWWESVWQSTQTQSQWLSTSC